MNNIAIAMERVKEIISFLIKLYPNQDWDEIEQDIKNGYTTLDKELYNMTKTLIFAKQNNNNNNQKLATRINQYLKTLANVSSSLSKNYRVVA